MTQSPGRGGPPAVQLLRGFELRVADRPVPLTPASERLVAFLAMQARSVRRSFVSGSLWPDATAERANANLRSALWRVPTVDRRPLVEASSTHLGLRPGVDIDFPDAMHLATAMVQTEAVDLVPELDRSLDLLEGDLLPDWCEDWVVFERERYRQLRLHAMDQVCTCLIRRCRYGEAMRIAMGAIAADPLRESGFRFAVRSTWPRATSSRPSSSTARTPSACAPSSAPSPQPSCAACSTTSTAGSPALRWRSTDTDAVLRWRGGRPRAERSAQLGKVFSRSWRSSGLHHSRLPSVTRVICTSGLPSFPPRTPDRVAITPVPLRTTSAGHPATATAHTTLPVRPACVAPAVACR